jgi:hypothetical protein
MMPSVEVVVVQAKLDPTACRLMVEMEVMGSYR